MKEILLIIDFGSQYTQLIARRVRELNVCSEIVPFNKFSTIPNNTKGIILSGGPSSVTDSNTPSINLEIIRKKIPLLALCYGAQLIAHKLGGKVEKSFELAAFWTRKAFENDSIDPYAQERAQRLWEKFELWEYEEQKSININKKTLEMLKEHCEKYPDSWVCDIFYY